MTKRHVQLERFLRCEALEPRRLLAGDVTVNVNNAGHLIIRGDALSNAIQVEAGLLPGEFIITGAQDDQSVGTTVNGLSSVTVSGVTGDIRIQTNAGNDSLQMGFGGAIDIAGSLKITTDGDNDSVEVRNTTVGGDIIVQTGDAEDFVQFANISVAGDASFVTGDAGGPIAQDTVLLDALTATGSTVLIRGGDGFNSFGVTNSNLADLKINTGVGDSFTAIGNSDISGSVLFNGDASDTLTASTLHVGGELTLRLGAGDDSANFDTSSVFDGTILVTGGAGIKTVAFGASTLNGDVNISLGGGMNVIGFQDNTIVNGNVNIVTNGGDDQVYVLQSHIVGTFTANLGAGADLFFSQDAEFDSAVSILFGTGDDTLELGNSIFHSTAVFDGGKGFDTVVDDGGNSFDIVPVELRFEA